MPPPWGQLLQLRRDRQEHRLRARRTHQLDRGGDSVGAYAHWHGDGGQTGEVPWGGEGGHREPERRVERPGPGGPAGPPDGLRRRWRAGQRWYHHEVEAAAAEPRNALLLPKRSFAGTDQAVPKRERSQLGVSPGPRLKTRPIKGPAPSHPHPRPSHTRSRRRPPPAAPGSGAGRPPHRAPRRRAAGPHGLQQHGPDDRAAPRAPDCAAQHSGNREQAVTALRRRRRPVAASTLVRLRPASTVSERASLWPTPEPPRGCPRKSPSQPPRHARPALRTHRPISPPTRLYAQADPGTSREGRRSFHGLAAAGHRARVRVSVVPAPPVAGSPRTYGAAAHP
jgi:hypothetical protein